MRASTVARAAADLSLGFIMGLAAVVCAHVVGWATPLIGYSPELRTGLREVGAFLLPDEDAPWA